MVETITFVGISRGNRIVPGKAMVDTITLVCILQGNPIISG